jgi:hypothetical protein
MKTSEMNSVTLGHLILYKSHESVLVTKEKKKKNKEVTTKTSPGSIKSSSKNLAQLTSGYKLNTRDGKINEVAGYAGLDKICRTRKRGKYSQVQSRQVTSRHLLSNYSNVTSTSHAQHHTQLSGLFLFPFHSFGSPSHSFQTPRNHFTSTSNNRGARKKQLRLTS